MSAESDRTTALRLRERLAAADAEISTPAGLRERVRAPERRPGTARPPDRRHREGRVRALVTVALAAVAVAVVMSGAWWLMRTGGAGPAEGGGAVPVTVTVHNAEKACRYERTLECALRVAVDPYERYAAAGNRAAVVWHGDRLDASCVVPDGTLVTDESGISSTRWYRVRTQDGAEGWLPGVRTRNSTEVRVCRAQEKPAPPDGG